MMEVLGIDVGFGFTKATNGKEFVIFKSLLGEAAEIQFHSTFGDMSLASNLHVTIDDKSFFIGDYAEKQSHVRRFTLDQEKMISEFVNIMALTAAGTYADNGITLNIVSGLPVGYLKQDYQKFIDALSGTHTVTYHKPDGSSVDKVIKVGSVQMMPQPLGSIFNLLMDDNGKLVNTDLSKQKVGVVDIGFRTTDLTVFDRLQYVERGSSTMDTGISKSYGIIADKLKKESGVHIELFRLYKAVETGFIKIRGKEFDISNLRDKVYAHAATEIAGDINRLWADEWDIDTIVLTGGGSKVLSKYLEPLLPGHIVPFDNAIDARLNNVQGYLKYGRNKWCKPPVAVKPPEFADNDKKEEETSEPDKVKDAREADDKHSKWRKR